jgi:hypothetical protein
MMKLFNYIMGLKFRTPMSASSPIGLRFGFLVTIVSFFAFLSATLALPVNPSALCFYSSANDQFNRNTDLVGAAYQTYLDFSS